LSRYSRPGLSTGASLKGFQFSASGSRTYLLLISALAVKIVLSALSVWGYEFRYWARASTIHYPMLPSSRTPIAYLMNAIYGVWLLLPLEHPGLYWLIDGAFTPSASIYMLAIMLKAPILIADILCGLLIYRMAFEYAGRHQAFAALALWLLNPYITLTAEMQGSIDLIPTFFVLASVLFFMRNKLSLSALSLASGTAIKFYPLLLLPLFCLFPLRLERRKELAKFILASLLGVSAYVYWVTSSGMNFLLTFTEFSPLTQEFLEIGLVTPYAPRLGLSTIFCFVYLYAFYQCWRAGQESLVDAVLGFLLVLMAFLNWQPQYLLWIMPFLTLDCALKKTRGAYFASYLLTALLFQLIAFNLTLGNSLFYIPNYTVQMQSASDFLSQISKDAATVIVGKPILRSCFAAISLLCSAKIFLRNAPSLKALLPQIGTP